MVRFNSESLLERLFEMLLGSYQVTMGLAFFSPSRYLSRYTLGYLAQRFSLRLLGYGYKHLEQALPSVYTLQCLTSKVDNNTNNSYS